MSADPLFDVSHEVVVITGTEGCLGASYAAAFLERGAKVAGLDRTLSERSAKLSATFGDRFLPMEGDVTSKASMQRALETVHDTWGAPSVLLNNAGLDSPPSAPAEENGPFEEYPEESWNKVLDVNLKGVFLCCQVFGAAMAKESRGSIINVASIYGLVSPDQSLYEYRRKRGETFFKPVAYSASKSGIYNLTRYLAQYWARKSVRVNSLTIAGVLSGQDEAFLEAYCGRIPVGRMADEHEYDGAILFLASAASRYMTGANLVIDGGWTAI